LKKKNKVQIKSVVAACFVTGERERGKRENETMMQGFAFILFVISADTIHFAKGRKRKKNCFDINIKTEKNNFFLSPKSLSLFLL